ncbi:MAG: 4Fe-4S binding protein [Nitrospinae bacterium]|nr:4Fe-4S binding protein [Nitrospinota bacterium]
MTTLFNSYYIENTLEFNADKCVNCGVCVIVCPHAVFAENGGVVSVSKKSACMECGACMKNCPVDAIKVDAGVGCASAMIYAAIYGGEPTCGCDSEGNQAGCC